jgi:hypothetical protein
LVKTWCWCWLIYCVIYYIFYYLLQVRKLIFLWFEIKNLFKSIIYNVQLCINLVHIFIMKTQFSVEERRQCMRAKKPEKERKTQPAATTSQFFSRVFDLLSAFSAIQVTKYKCKNRESRFPCIQLFSVLKQRLLLFYLYIGKYRSIFVFSESSQQECSSNYVMKEQRARFIKCFMTHKRYKLQSTFFTSVRLQSYSRLLLDTSSIQYHTTIILT